MTAGPPSRGTQPPSARPNRADRMSPARTRPGGQKRPHLGDTIGAEMLAARLPFGPRQFEFSFAYKSGRNAALNAAADEIKAAQGALSGADIDRLHDIYLSPWRMAEKPDGM